MTTAHTQTVRRDIQLKCIEIATMKMEIFTPRNKDVALAMVEGHAATHGRGWEYRIEFLRPGDHRDPMRFWNT